jgi:hypothetical protein
MLAVTELPRVPSFPTCGGVVACDRWAAYCDLEKAQPLRLHRSARLQANAAQSRVEALRTSRGRLGPAEARNTKLGIMFAAQPIGCDGFRLLRQRGRRCVARARGAGPVQSNGSVTTIDGQPIPEAIGRVANQTGTALSASAAPSQDISAPAASARGVCGCADRDALHRTGTICGG